MLGCATDARGLKEKRAMQRERGEKSSGQQLQTILSINLLLPSIYQPTARLLPDIFYHTLVQISSIHSSFCSNSICLFPSFLPLSSAFFHPDSDLQFSHRILICLSLLVKTLCGRVVFGKICILWDIIGSLGPSPFSGSLQILSGPIKPLFWGPTYLLPFLCGPISLFIL